MEMPAIQFIASTWLMSKWNGMPFVDGGPFIPHVPNNSFTYSILQVHYLPSCDCIAIWPAGMPRDSFCVGWLAGHTQWICQVLVVDGPPKAIYSDLNSSYRVQMHHKLTETSLWFDEGIILPACLPAARVHPSIDIYLVMMIWCWCIPVKRCLFIGEIRNCLCNRPSLLSLPMFVKVSFGHTQNKISQVE